jgi:hypothetical protein
MKNLLIDCDTVMDAVYEGEEDSSLPMLTRLRIGLHLLFCPDCAENLRKFRCVEELLSTDFFPPSPDFEESVMERVYQEACEPDEIDAPAGFSFRSWVITGFIVLLSLSSAFFGMNFTHIAQSEGSSFLLPVGITIGMIVTCYGALFIGSHLKELSAYFKLTESDSVDNF